MLKINISIKKIPNILSVLRLFLSLPLIIFLELKKTNIVFLIIILAGITDYLDGYIARKFNLKTKFGAIIDPLADKIFIIIPLLWLSQKNLIPFWSISIIFLRELIISALRKTSKDGMPASTLGKYKTFFLFISLAMFFLPLENNLITNISLFFYWIGFLLTIITGLYYLNIK